MNIIAKINPIISAPNIIAFQSKLGHKLQASPEREYLFSQSLQRIPLYPVSH